MGMAAGPEKVLPLPGEVFLVGGQVAFAMVPEVAAGAGGRQWVWYAPTLPNLPGVEERWMFRRFLEAGVAVVGIDVGESYGSPEGRALFSALYAELRERRGFAARGVLLGRSRGGLMGLSWAAENAGKVSGFAGIYPVCNVASYPGVERACGAYHLSAEAFRAQLREHNPVDRLGALARGGVPLFAIHGDSDEVVPLGANSQLVKDRYEGLGGKMELVVPAGQGHNMWPGFFECEALVEFVVRRARAGGEG